jgi:hypothetical protein
VLHRPWYAPQAVNRTMAAGLNQLNAFALAIIPFLLLSDELSVGLLTSASGVVAAIVALSARRVKPRRQLTVGYGAYGLRGLAAVAFVSFWTAPLMVVWQIIGKLATPLHDPLQQSLDIHNDSLIQGESSKRQALAINLLNKTLVLIGSTLAFGGFLAINAASGAHQTVILQALILIFAAWRFVNLGWSARINRQTLAGIRYRPLPVLLQHSHLMLRGTLRNRLSRVQLALVSITPGLRRQLSES